MRDSLREAISLTRDSATQVATAVRELKQRAAQVGPAACVSVTGDRRFAEDLGQAARIEQHGHQLSTTPTPASRAASARASSRVAIGIWRRRHSSKYAAS